MSTKAEAKMRYLESVKVSLEAVADLHAADALKASALRQCEVARLAESQAQIDAMTAGWTPDELREMHGRVCRR